MGQGSKEGAANFSSGGRVGGYGRNYGTVVIELRGQGGNGTRLHAGGMEGVPIWPLFHFGNRCKMGRMAFTEGQQVRVKGGQASGVVARKLAYLQDMYVVQLDGNHLPPKKLAHESDLELVLRGDDRQRA